MKETCTHKTRSALSTTSIRLPAHEGVCLRIENGEIILDVPSDAIAGLMASVEDVQEPRAYSTIANEARRIGISERTLRTYLHEQGLPFIRLPGGDVRLSPSDVDEWMADRRVKK